MSVEEIRAVVDMWAEQYVEFAARDDIGYVQVFENRGSEQSASAWADMGEPVGADRSRCGTGRAGGLLRGEGRVLLCEYLAMEQALRARGIRTTLSPV
jgi:UDPglucose--hexose-1-phosphate uridylyltransferase